MIVTEVPKESYTENERVRKFCQSIFHFSIFFV